MCYGEKGALVDGEHVASRDSHRLTRLFVEQVGRRLQLQTFMSQNQFCLLVKFFTSRFEYEASLELSRSVRIVHGSVA